MKSKVDKKAQGRLLIFLEKFTHYIKKQRHLKIQGIKIQLKGRLNGIARSKKWSFSIGKLQLQQIDKNIDFNFKNAYTIFGKFGIKVWITHKN